MTRTTVMVGLVPVLGGLLLLGGCTTLDYEGYGGPSYPAYPRSVYVEEYRYRNPDGMLVAYDPGPRLYSVVSSPGLYWHDGYYYRRHGGHWERSHYHRGPWAYHRHAPPRVRHRHDHHPPRGLVLVDAHDRRHDWGPGDWRRHDRDGDRFVRGPQEQRPAPRRTPEPDRRQLERMPVPQPIPWVAGPNRGQSPPTPRVPSETQRIRRRADVKPPSGAIGGSLPVVDGRFPEGARSRAGRWEATPPVGSRGRPRDSGTWAPSPRANRSSEAGRIPTRSLVPGSNSAANPGASQRRESLAPVQKDRRSADHGSSKQRHIGSPVQDEKRRPSGPRDGLSAVSISERP